MIKKINNFLIYNNNHNINSAEDHLELLKFIKKDLKFNKIKSKLKFNYKKVLFIENFLHPYEFIKILFFILFFRGKKYLVNTEFITLSNNNYTFNDFDRENKMSLIKCFLNFTISDILISRCFKITISDYQKRINYLSYYRLRFFTAKFFFNFFDVIILAHPKMKYISSTNQKILLFPYLFPKIKIPKNIKNKKFKLNFSGFLTPFRFNSLKNLKVNENIFDTSQIKNILKHKTINQFIYSSDNNKDLVFSLNIEKEKNWKFSSPGRFYNNLKKNQIPIVFKNFNDEFSGICLNNKILLSRDKQNVLNLIDKLNKNIEKYKSKFFIKRLTKLINS